MPWIATWPWGSMIHGAAAVNRKISAKSRPGLSRGTYDRTTFDAGPDGRLSDRTGNHQAESARARLRPRRPENDSDQPAGDRLSACSIHEGFYCNRRSVAATSLTSGGLAARSARRPESVASRSPYLLIALIAASSDSLKQLRTFLSGE